MGETQTRRQPARLTYRDGEVMVTPENWDVFFINASQAVEACQAALRWQEIRREERERFEKTFLQPVYNWCVERKDKVSGCYVPIPTAGLLRVFIVTSSPRFDFALAQEIAALELSLVQLKWSVNLVQIPGAGNESIGTFLDVEEAMEIYAQREPAPGEG